MILHRQSSLELLPTTTTTKVHHVSFDNHFHSSSSKVKSGGGSGVVGGGGGSRSIGGIVGVVLIRFSCIAPTVLLRFYPAWLNFGVNMRMRQFILGIILENDIWNCCYLE